MTEVFLKGEFSEYKKENLTEARQAIYESYSRLPPGMLGLMVERTTVFISHKHDDLDDLKGIIGFLEKNYNVSCYIDSRDKSMPQITSAETATKIKSRIKKCDKFILLASNGAINSKWCNWELGYGDAQKFKDNIALFSFRQSDEAYEGQEYLNIYPHIVRIERPLLVSNEYISPGYYVRETIKSNTYMPLRQWLMR